MFLTLVCYHFRGCSLHVNGTPYIFLFYEFLVKFKSHFLNKCVSEFPNICEIFEYTRLKTSKEHYYLDSSSQKVYALSMQRTVNPNSGINRMTYRVSKNKRSMSKKKYSEQFINLLQTKQKKLNKEEINLNLEKTVLIY